MMKKILSATLAVTLLGTTFGGCDENNTPLITEPSSDASFSSVSLPETSNETSPTPPRPLTDQEREANEVLAQLERELSLTGTWLNVITSVGELETFTLLEPWNSSGAWWVRDIEGVRKQGTESDWIAKIQSYDAAFFGEQHLIIIEHSVPQDNYSRILRVEESGEIVIGTLGGSALTMDETYFLIVELGNDFSQNTLNLTYVSVNPHFTVGMIAHRNSDGRLTSFDTLNEAIVAGIMTQEEFETLLSAES